MNILQLEALSITTVTFILSFALAFYITRKYRKAKKTNLLFWSSGMQAFAVGVFIEMIFALGVVTGFLTAFYLFLVAVIVELLALGSIQLIKSPAAKKVYYVYCLLTTLLLLYSVLTSNASNFVVNYVAWGVPPLLVTIFSTLITIPAAAVLIIVAALSYRRKRSPGMLSIIAGVVFVSIAGTLYIVSFPSLLYISEFVGILLLWYGFYSG
ncbi:MAG: hypothetical protein KGH94_04565 [Candidatus Micrarchaeota archaeon]|nr:hypothetical protein [Candidatus Micrarchaeota archaeon]